ncbi:MAG: DUF2271 domain-containing protein, partial [Planctomycetota bacterium]
IGRERWLRDLRRWHRLHKDDRTLIDAVTRPTRNPGSYSLAFDGLDTFATVLVNDVEVARTKNMHRRYRFDVKPHLRQGVNTLTVNFDAPLPRSWDEYDRLGDFPGSGGGSEEQQPFNLQRKMACNYGWDWGPIVPTCGIWRDVRLEAWSVGRLGDVRPIVTKADPSLAIVEVHADVAGSGDVVATLIAPDGQTFTGSTIEVPDPQRWWPVGHGEQPLYDLHVKLQRDGTVLDEKKRRVGLRTVRLETRDDQPGDPRPADELGEGTSMQLFVNETPVYCKGSNWIPDDCFPHRVDKARYRRRIEQAKNANMNMLRIWGGGLFESDDLYDICDELGVMVWQDFLFACAAYHEDEQTKEEVDAEVRDNVARLAGRASLVLWNGCNENLWGYHDWLYRGKKWPEFVGDRGWGLYYYFDLLPKVVAQLDPATPYWPGSPSNGGDVANFESTYPNANEIGNRHVWNVWHGPGHYLNYLGHFPRFCSEFGFHGPACWPTIERSTPHDQRRWDSNVMRLHNKNGLSEVGDGQDKSTVRMSEDFAVPEAGSDASFDDWLYLSQVIQARALSVGVGWFRSLAPWNSGALYWQINDCWPCSSWSAIDGDGRAKPLLHATRRFFAPRAINVGPRKPTKVGGWDEDAGPLRVYLHNDHAEAWHAKLRIELRTYAGEVLNEHAASLDIDARGVAQLDIPDDWPRRADAFIYVEADSGETAWWWFKPDKDAPLPTPEFDTQVSEDGRVVTIVAKSLLRDVCLFADRLHPD